MLRVLLNELTRIQSHLVWLGTHAMDIGALTVFLYCFREREEILRIFENVSGQRMMTSYFRVGGVALEPPLDLYERIQNFLDIMPAKIAEYENLLTGNPIWINRLKGVGNLSRGGRHRSRRHRARRCAPAAWTGTCAATCPTPATRSSSSRCPSRTTATCGRATSSAWTRCASRSRSASRRSTACPRPDLADAPKVILPDREKMKTQMEALIHHFKIVTEGFPVPAGEVSKTNRTK